MTQTAELPVLEHIYRPIGSAKELFSYRGSEVLLSGAAGTGKSRACLEKIHMMCLLNPGMRGLVSRKTATSLGSTALVTFREFVAKEALEGGELKFYGGSSQMAACYRYGNGSVLVVGGMDKSTRIMSSEYDAIYVQEATELGEADWEALTTRLRNGKVSFQQLMADCNPDAPHHWLKRRSDAGKTNMVYCQHEDNPRLFNPDTKEWTTEGLSYIDKLEALSGVRYLRLRKGQWAAAEGLVYDTFDPTVHFYKHIDKPPADWRRLWSIDFGFTNPFVWQCWAEDPDGRLYLYKEIYSSRRLVEEHAVAIRAATKGEPAPWAVVCDHDAEGRATLEEKLGISTIAAHKSVLEGIEAVKARLKVQADGKPRLYLCRDALTDRDLLLEDSKKPVSTSQEILEYVWHDTTGRKEQPLKVNDHGCDAMRYAVAHLDLKGSPRIRTLRW